jgi:NodT family efflux transporter outer membrane factor (OMF) lipoprotein
VRPIIVAVATVALASACATPDPPQPLPLQDAPAFSSSDGLPRSDRWWEEFDDPSLSACIESALTNSFTLRAAYQRLQQARAIARVEEARRSPTLDVLAGGAERDGSETDRQSDISLGLQASYEVDLWGRIRSEIEAERLEASATAEDYQAAAVSLSAEIARALYRLTEASAQLALLESQLKTNQDVLLVIEGRFSIGQSGGADVLRQRQLVEATAEQQIISRASIELLEHQILVLLGSPPQSRLGIDRPKSLPDIASLPEIGLPSDLLQRRPDVRAAYLRLQSADASVAAAVKDQYPTLNLGATITTAAESPSGLFDTWIGSLTAQLLAPVVDGGRRRREVERTVAVRRQLLAEYGATVLASFQEVEDALALERHQLDRVESLNRQLALASTTSVEIRNQYLNGAAGFIDVLIAARNQQELERSVLAARLMLIEHRISLHRAIAGGFIDASQAIPGDGAPRADETGTKGTR